MTFNRFARDLRRSRIRALENLCYAEPDEDGAIAAAGGAEDQPAEAETDEQTPPETPAEGEEGAQAAAEPAETEEKRVPWFQKRINELTAARRAEESAKRQLMTENEALKALLNPTQRAEGAPPAAEQPKAPPVAPQDFEKAVADRAAAMLREQEIVRQSNEVYQKGKTQFAEKFDGALQNLQAAGVYSAEDMSFVEAAMATEAPELVLYELGNNPEEAMRLAALPQTQRAVQLDRMARDLKSPAQRVSGAPPPVTPLSAARVAKQFDPSDTKTPTDVWMREREKQIAARRAAR